MKKFIFILTFILIVSGGVFMLKEKKTITIGLGGDTMIGRLTNEVINQNGCPYIWGNLLPIMQSTDFNFVNLETTLTTSEKIVPKTFNFKSDPGHASCLTLANIQGVNIANNHILDFSEEGLIETLNSLDSQNIKHIGAEKNLEEASAPIIIEKNGIKIGFLGYADYPKDWAATSISPGINYIRIGDINRIKHDISQLKKAVDIIVASMHWGPNMRTHPTQEFINFAHEIIDAGADIFHGHSAHIFQGIEKYKNKLIFYDMGELIDDYAVDPILRNNCSIFALITLNKKELISFKVVPLFIDHMQVNKAKDKNHEWIAQRIKKLSEEFNTEVHIEH
ncbi:TPA: poly-gamma-glutamate biosynthesis protein [Candidatus Dependentiae bacterium]|nr:MAG: hypothetical protein US03_C0002G0079 [candidate division TM6 bacterium GW2011_GWF2_36_131]KKQ03513.1 MAG: hypothetical protein US13_C0002G0079 [candidate division TM6 bacterium GW2011_GWE2_36_25]KKQ20213.1 MAG: hypothetical protein US32_C0001G0110 [candidate division TM6 bacterium GW2011_GWA2_36_9]HBR70753.1 poly-gamma-glutamate biosynthesis protein [Candidatus Dependentiae bacterium]HCU00138.1 poly-gamma-glutamate biosynthesis protein [Candidatus Dependentiae bacterium]